MDARIKRTRRAAAVATVVGIAVGASLFATLAGTAAAAPGAPHLTPREAIAFARQSPTIRRALADASSPAAEAIPPRASRPYWVIVWTHRGSPLALAFVDDAAHRVLDAGGGAQAALAAEIPLNAWDTNVPFPGRRLTSHDVIALALRSAALRHAVARFRAAVPAAWPTGIGSQWRVDWFVGASDKVLAHFDARTRTLTGFWTGRQLAWAISRGDPIYTGDAAGAWYVWAALCVLFLAPFVDPRRLRRSLHLDLVALLAFSASTAFFDHGDLSGSVPLIYPVLAYLFVRLLVIGLRPRPNDEKLVPLASERLLLIGIACLVIVRIVLNVTDSIPLDVGTASYTGAHQVVHGLGLYDGSLGRLVPGGDTYGPVNYLAYVPFAILFPGTHGVAYPGAHAAAISFDLLAMAGLFLLGRRLGHGRDRRVLSVALPYAWAAYPYTTFTLMENTNDALVACLVIFTLLALTSPARRGVVLALATMTKFFPLILAPVVGSGTGPARTRTWLVFLAALAATAVVTTVPFAASPSALHAFYEHTLAYQLRRSSPLSIWGQYPSLSALQRILEGGTILLAGGLAFVPRRRSAGQVAALCACLIIAVEACANYWYYTYVVWFAPAAFVAVFSAYGGRSIATAPAAAPEAGVAAGETALVA